MPRLCGFIFHFIYTLYQMMLQRPQLNDTWILMGKFRRNVSSAVFRNQMEDRLLTNKLGSIELEEKRLLRRFRSETRLMRIKQEQRLGSGLTCARRNEVNGTHINKAGTPSTQSAGATCPLDFGKLQFGVDKRQSSASIYASRECPVNTSGGETFITGGEWTQPSRRLPRLPSVNGKKTPEPLSPSKDSCQSPVIRKGTRNPPIVIQDTMTSVDKTFPTEANEAKGILQGNHGNSNNSNSIVTAEPHQESNGPRMRRQTWNGKTLPKLPESQPETARKRSFSDKDQPAQIHRKSSLWDSTKRALDSCLPSDESVFVNDSNTSWNKTTFSTAENALRRRFLSVPEHPVRKSKSLNSVKALECLPPVLESEDCQAASMGCQVDRVNEGAASGIDPFQVGGKETGNAVYQPSSQRRHQRLSRQNNVTRDPLSGNASKIPTEGFIEFPKYGEIEFSAARKVSVKYNTGQSVKYRIWQTANLHEELTNKETTETKKQREKLNTRSNFSSPLLGQSSNEEIIIGIPKRKEHVKPRKRVLDKALETKDEEEKVLAPMDKLNWKKALRMVCNVNIFLSGMVALRKQRELDHLAVKIKQDALEKLFQELKHCRYLRLPYNEDDEKFDFISWVFQKD